ncbi:PREDICTED: ABC transporter A family member 1-like isoform X1 [Prunus mume]|uniref:ABC transporter A family member 1-like isoform X1 n=1 Tax=Prunus mume TaxID=102107 RepID=A0ABM1LWA3_PRUMU|nr:PREDICTED: ABC transporter A family member 1-like isoform X1 [Prunus mume]
MFVEVGKGISPNFERVLELLLNKEEFLAFAPDTEETRSMINIISVKFPLLKNVSRVYKDEQELETYIGSDLYGTCNQIMHLLGFLYPISRLISYSVFEKEQKIREGLYMMGLEDGIFHLMVYCI